MIPPHPTLNNKPLQGDCLAHTHYEPGTKDKTHHSENSSKMHKPCSGAAGLQSPPVTYMHICETEVFSMGVFLLRPGASIPLHDHPDMNGNPRSC
ncbi:unnamed protein product [Pleuronectes platessa]|uniref:2-aminoethanethiol dioxygenase n=1 Tax=Pleuronectes platessa TaxID=8262 RepID=A0A9N7YGY4_PLEPL|nr:unnamed protein product [Pleuronectes platessa]